MGYQGFTEQFSRLLDLALNMYVSLKADALLFLPESSLDWDQFRNVVQETKVVVAGDTQQQVELAAKANFSTVVLNMADSPVYDKLTQAVLESVADDILKPGSQVVAMYSGFEPDTVDSLTLINFREHLGRLTSRDLRQLESCVPLETLKLVVDLAVEIGREGREGNPVGTLFVIGDSKKVLTHSREIGFDPMKGYTRKERELTDRRVREGVKEIAQLDGGFIINTDNVVESACRYIDAPAKGITMSKGLGTRHWTAAAITKLCKSVAVAVSQSTGTVRIFENGEVVLRIEPFRRAMKWREYEIEPPSSSKDDNKPKDKVEPIRIKSDS